MSKITKATFKSFVKKHRTKLHIMCKSDFDGQYDCIMPTGNTKFVTAKPADHVHENNLGINGVWLVGGSRDYFREYVDSDGFVGIDVYNCCGSFTVAIKDPQTAALKVLSV